MWTTHDGPGWLMILGALFWIAFLGVVVYLVARLASAHSSAPAAASPEPLEIARRRYAAGDITREEFLALCADLTAPPDHAPHDAMSGGQSQL